MPKSVTEIPCIVMIMDEKGSGMTDWSAWSIKHPVSKLSGPLSFPVSFLFPNQT